MEERRTNMVYGLAIIMMGGTHSRPPKMCIIEKKNSQPKYMLCCSKELSHWDGSFKNPEMFKLVDKEITILRSKMLFILTCT